MIETSSLFFRWSRLSSSRHSGCWSGATTIGSAEHLKDPDVCGEQLRGGGAGTELFINEWWGWGPLRSLTTTGKHCALILTQYSSSLILSQSIVSSTRKTLGLNFASPVLRKKFSWFFALKGGKLSDFREYILFWLRSVVPKLGSANQMGSVQQF